MLTNLNDGSPDSLLRQEDLSGCKFLALLFNDAKVSRAFPRAYQMKVSDHVQVPSLSKDVGIVKDFREKWPGAGKRVSQGYTAQTHIGHSDPMTSKP